jgi:hypothetical protein
MIFTSWDNPRNTSRQERLASLEVAVANDSESRATGDGLVQGSHLRSYGWVNGIWDVRGESMSTFIFPLMGISEESDAVGPQLEGHDTRSTGIKRKRHDDMDEG